MWATVGSRPRNVLSELRSRFPTLSGNVTNAPRNVASSSRNIGRTNRTATRVCAIKDIVIVGANTEKTPQAREEKVQLERKNRVISGFAIEKTWNDKTLYSKVKAQFPDDCKDIDFEFVKNCYGTLIKPRLANGVKIDGSILLKSIASTTTVYVRLFADDFDDSEFEKSPFEFEEKKSEKEDDPSAILHDADKTTAGNIVR